MKPERLAPRPSIDDVRDGGHYSLPGSLSQEQTNLFFNVARAGDLFIKVPTDRGLGDYRVFIRDEQVTEADIRPLEGAERLEQLDQAIERLPWLASIADADRECAHYLAVHWLQYDRLRARGIIGIPESRFGVYVARAEPQARDEGRGPNPAIFQQRVPGATLWEMFDFDALRIRPAWTPFKATIAAQLQVLLESGLADHVDWNIKNFVFHGAEQRLYYVDSKPTIFVASGSNEQNLAGIRKHFLA